MSDKDQETESLELTWLDIYLLGVYAAYVLVAIFFISVGGEDLFVRLNIVVSSTAAGLFAAFLIMGFWQILSGAFTGDGWEETKKKHYFEHVSITLAFFFFLSQI